MKVKVLSQASVSFNPVHMEGVESVHIKRLITKSDGAPRMAMRLFEILPGGHTPFHSHEWEQMNYILEGEGVLRTAEGDIVVKPGDACFIPGTAMHQYRNDGDALFRFLCMVPVERD